VGEKQQDFAQRGEMKTAVMGKVTEEFQREGGQRMTQRTKGGKHLGGGLDAGAGGLRRDGWQGNSIATNGG